jgi:hypothetical protein
VMTIREFGDKYRVRVNDKKHAQKFRIESSEDVVYGRFGEIVTDESYGDVFAVKFIATPRNASMNGALLSRYRKALGGGLTLKRKYGDAESTFHFDPANAAQVALVFELLKPKKRAVRVLTDEQKNALRDRLKAVRTVRSLPLAA